GGVQLTVSGQGRPATQKEMTAKELVYATRNAIVRLETFGVAEFEVKVRKGKDEKLIKVEKEVIEGGTGFIVPGGFIVTNNHVLEVEKPKGAKAVRTSGSRGTFAFDTRDPFGKSPLTAEATADPRNDLIQ